MGTELLLLVGDTAMERGRGGLFVDASARGSVGRVLGEKVTMTLITSMR